MLLTEPEAALLLLHPLVLGFHRDGGGQGTERGVIRYQLVTTCLIKTFTLTLCIVHIYRFIVHAGLDYLSSPIDLI